LQQGRENKTQQGARTAKQTGNVSPTTLQIPTGKEGNQRSWRQRLQHSLQRKLFSTTGRLKELMQDYSLRPIQTGCSRQTKKNTKDEQGPVDHNPLKNTCEEQAGSFPCTHIRRQKKKRQHTPSPATAGCTFKGWLHEDQPPPPSETRGSSPTENQKWLPRGVLLSVTSKKKPRPIRSIRVGWQ